MGRTAGAVSLPGMLQGVAWTSAMSWKTPSRRACSVAVAMMRRTSGVSAAAVGVVLVAGVGGSSSGAWSGQGVSLGGVLGVQGRTAQRSRMWSRMAGRSALAAGEASGCPAAARRRSRAAARSSPRWCHQEKTRLMVSLWPAPGGRSRFSLKLMQTWGQARTEYMEDAPSRRQSCAPSRSLPT
ncbi:hypothetical protein E1286_46220 [Nonomuraea terrae]|uniref:Uncharacterized protein n=1 Tax=Nonomuraea terrae TaxID=2530383 RepID=A0A4R4XGL2_9ACTN|nr:hypothetical protein [Nonomuraea terrae]TDD29874.1 hypothetical protein E1286_46220 [Nonomuraea terrae]